MTLNRRRLLAAATSLLPCLQATAATLRAIERSSLTRIVVGFPPGGPVDRVARLVANQLGAAESHAAGVTVDNRSGAGGQLAIQHVKSSAPDGRTLLLTPMSMLGLYPHTYQRLAYDPMVDLEPVTQAVVVDCGFAVGPLVPASVQSLHDFLNWCKQHPSMASFGSPGAGSSPHFVGALMGQAAGVKLEHIAYRGTLPAVQDMVAGHVAAACAPTGDFIEPMAAGTCRLLATTATRRGRFTPETPTLRELGFQDIAFSEWFGVFTPSGTPPSVIQTLHAALNTALQAGSVRTTLAQTHIEVQTSTPDRLGAMLQTDTALWASLVASTGFKAN